MRNLPNQFRQRYFETLNNNLQILENNGLRFHSALEKNIYDSLHSQIKALHQTGAQNEQQRLKVTVLQKQVQRMEETYTIDFYKESHKRLEKRVSWVNPSLALISDSFRQQYMARLGQLQSLEENYSISFKGEVQRVLYGQLLLAFQEIEKKAVESAGDIVHALYKDKLNLQDQLTRIEKSSGIYEINT